MKLVGIGFIATALLAVSCRKAEVALPGSDSSPPAAETPGKSHVEAPAGSESESAGENQRTRALPRPEDRKYPAPVAPANEPLPIAAPIEGKPGYVTSPYNGKAIDVRDIPPGTLVADPTFPVSEKKYFRMP